MLKQALLFLSFFLSVLLVCQPSAGAQGLNDSFRSTVRARFGERLAYFTVVPYKNTAFATAYDVNSSVRNSTGRKTHWAVYEHIQGHWSYIFEFDSTVDADEETGRLNRLFAKYQFSSDMRAKLMYGNEQRL